MFIKNEWLLISYLLDRSKFQSEYNIKGVPDDTLYQIKLELLYSFKLNSSV